MSSNTYSVITGTGSYIPTKVIKNDNFINNAFYNRSGERLPKSNEEIITKFQEITTIEERRYVTDDLNTSDIAFLAAEKAIEAAGIDKETLDYIIVGHNFGDINHGSNRVNICPSLAARVKHKLKIENPKAIAYDLPFGCPGWLQGVIQADYFLKSGDAKKALVIGAEVLSRIIDPHDIDSMIYADGAGAIILEAKQSDEPIGILAHSARSDAYRYSEMLVMDKSYNKNDKNDQNLYLKMSGRRLYQYALEHVPGALKNCLDKSNTPIIDIKKVLIHQANGKMDDAILKRFYDLFEGETMPEGIMPMTISKLGNSSVATVPTLLDLILNDQMKGHSIEKGDTILFASVGAGMNINGVVYKF